MSAPFDHQASAVEMRVREVLAGYDRGWAFTPLSGKRPTQGGWSTAPRPTREECGAWARAGNVGLRTGAISGVVVVDIDEGADTSALDLPRTVTVVTGKGRHLYYQAPSIPIHNSASKLAPNVDVRGEGGQVVFVGSIHPDTGGAYRWAEGRSPEEIEVAPLPAWIVGRLSPPGTGQRPALSLVPNCSSGCTPYGMTALLEEVARVRFAPEGSRNDTLNCAAFSLGQLVGGGVLEQTEVESALIAATSLEETEASATIRSGISAGFEEPRSAPDSPRGPACEQALSRILVPGGHTDDRGNYTEVGEGDFARELLNALPKGRLYRRGEPALCGELLGDAGSRYFSRVEPDAMRIVMSDHARLVRWKKAARSDTQVQIVCDATGPLAGLVIAEARIHEGLRELDLIVPFPAYGCRPGWNENKVYYDEAPGLEDLRPEQDREIIDNALEDLLIDFPFKDEASRQNFIGAMLTLLLRVIIDGNVPMFLVLSSLERTGKTKLIEQVLGGLLMGHAIPALQLGGKDDEIDKRLVGLLLRGKPIVHLDNLRAFIDSGALASLLTAERYQGRILGGNSMPELRNRTVLVASGNNVRMTGEMVKRTVPIILQPTDEAPELRTDFRHPDLRTFVRENRRLMLECLLGMVARWDVRGRPPGKARLGGFESWAEIVGGVMAVQGFDEWLTNARTWQREADPHGEDLLTFVEAWHSSFQTGFASATQLLDLAMENDVFLSEIRGTTEKGRLNSFSRQVLARHKNTPVGNHVIEQGERTSRSRLWQLVPVQEEATQ
jgi:Bifunctional DNA primase/polymerase, N-terminal